MDEFDLWECKKRSDCDVRKIISSNEWYTQATLPVVNLSLSRLSLIVIGTHNASLRGREQLFIRRSGRRSTADVDFGPAIYFKILRLECSDKR